MRRKTTFRFGRKHSTHVGLADYRRGALFTRQLLAHHAHPIPWKGVGEHDSIVYVICIAALPVIKGKADSATIESTYRIKGGYTIPLIGFGLCLWMISFSGAKSWMLVGILFVVGLVIYWLEQLRAKKQHAGTGIQ